MAKFDLKDPNNQKLLLGVMLLGALVYLFFFFSYAPQSEKIEALKVTKQEKEVRLRKAKVRAAKFDQLVADIKILETNLASAQAKLPREKDISAILTNITNIGQKALSPVVMVRPQNIVKKDFYAEVPITVHVEGSYHALGKFMARVGNLTRIINPSMLNITAYKGKKKKTTVESVEGPKTIRAVMTAKTFIFLPPEERK